MGHDHGINGTTKENGGTVCWRHNGRVSLEQCSMKLVAILQTAVYILNQLPLYTPIFPVGIYIGPVTRNRSRNYLYLPELRMTHGRNLCFHLHNSVLCGIRILFLKRGKVPLRNKIRESPIEFEVIAAIWPPSAPCAKESSGKNMSHHPLRVN